MKYLNLSGLSYFTNKIKSTVADALDGKSDVGHTHTKSEITDFPSGLTVDTTLDGTSSNAISNSAVSNALDGKSDVGHTHTKSEITDFPTLATVATSGSYNDLSNKPTTMTPTSHTHGNITNDGKIGSNANKPLITTTGGTVTTGSFGTSANTFCEGNDSRLSDARTPTAHTHSASDITSGLATVATSGSYNDLSNKPTIPTVNNGTLTIQKNGTTVDTFTANSSSDKTVNITVPTATSELTNDSGYITGVAWNDVSNKPTFATVATSGSYNDLSNKPTIPTVNDATLTIQKNGTTIDTFTANSSTDKTVNISVPTNTSELTNGAGFITADYAIPRSGGAVMTGYKLAMVANTAEFLLCGGTGWDDGSFISLHGKNHNDHANEAVIGADFQRMSMYPSGTWTWSGTACQIVSDQRLKQQITEIDDKLLDAWEDVELCQFKYNDAVDEKGDNARLHTGYVVQQINKACTSHGVDITQYGLFCHEEYPEETEEVEIEQADGTKTKETKVIREASEHYSLRYTEVYAVECMYLRRENSRLKEKLASLEERLEKLEKAENSENQEK